MRGEHVYNHDHDHAHDHEHEHSYSFGFGHSHEHGKLRGVRLGISIFLNLGITLAQVVGGVLSGSLSLLSDALHNFSDVVALLVSYFAERLAEKEHSLSQTYGFKRAEILAAFINSAVLVGIAVFLIKEAVVRFQQPVSIHSSWVIVFAGLSILVNAGSALLLRADAKESMNMRSAYLHLLSDMFTSVAVLLGGVGMMLFRVFWLDGVLSILVALYLVWASLGLLWKTVSVLMQFVPPGIDIEEIERALVAFPEVENIHHVHVWLLTDQEIHFDAHVDFREDLPLSAVGRVLQELERTLKERFSIAHVLLQPEFEVSDAKHLVVNGAGCIQGCKEAA